MNFYRLLFPVNKENVFKGLTYAMLLSATLHLLTCLYTAITTGNPDVVNMFNIIGVSLFFPELGHGNAYCLLGIITVIMIGVWFYAMQQYHDRHPSRDHPNTTPTHPKHRQK